jgi:hypothetical protein
MDRMSCDAGEHVGEPGLRIDVVELGRPMSLGPQGGKSCIVLPVIFSERISAALRTESIGSVETISVIEST